MRFKTLVLVLFATALAASACSDAANPTAAPTTSPQGTARNVPTATTEPPTATATATGTTVSSPTPSPTPAPTATPFPEIIVNRATFEMGPESSPFVDLLSRVPDTEESRELVRMYDTAATYGLLGFDVPGPSTTGDEWAEQYGEFYSRMEGAGIDPSAPWPIFPPWPQEMRRYSGTWHPHPYVRISPFMANQSITAGNRHSDIEVALGPDFSVVATDEALAACDCDQPDVNEYGGMSYYSWGEEGVGTLERRLAPPLYDHIGRGPRLLVGDGFAYYSAFNDQMEGMIDATLDNVPSLADLEEFSGAARWLDGMGTMGVITMFKGNFGIDDVMSDFRYRLVPADGPDGRTILVERTEETARQAYTSAPLLMAPTLAAGGLGHDGERPFAGFVLAYDDEATARQNMERLEARIRVGAFDGRLVDGEYAETPFSDLIERADLQQAGRFFIARIYMREPSQRIFYSFISRGWFGSSNSKHHLIIHE